MAGFNNKPTIYDTATASDDTAGVGVEERIKRAILKIKASRSRPCYQTTLSYVNRGGCKMELDELKEMLNVMIDKKVICNTGKEGNESLQVCVEENSQSADDISHTPELHSESTNNRTFY